jgi:poly-gamma-glutamate synthesis protein (capsule biosynthesis protein)
MSESKIILKAVGDICPGDMSILGLGVCSLSRKYGVSYPFSFVKDYLGNADIVIGNLEGILTSKAYSKTLRFCGVPEFAQGLRNAGFNVLSVANNHIFEQGIPGFNETITALERNGIFICGRRGEGEYYSNPVIINVKGETVGLLSYNWVGTTKFPDADRYIAQSCDSVVNYTWQRNPDVDKVNLQNIGARNIHVLNDIRRLKTCVDHVVVLPHWGFEFVHVPPFGVVQEAHSFIDAGADCIIGSHPHVLQGYEMYKGRMVFYSLGNFVFDMPVKESRKTALVEISLCKHVETSHAFSFFEINKKHQPVSASIDQADRISRIIDESNRILNGPDLAAALSDDAIYKAFEQQYNRQKVANILRHFYLMPLHPFIVTVTLSKVVNFLKLMISRIRGNKIRW